MNVQASMLGTFDVLYNCSTFPQKFSRQLLHFEFTFFRGNLINMS